MQAENAMLRRELRALQTVNAQSRDFMREANRALRENVEQLMGLDTARHQVIDNLRQELERERTAHKAVEQDLQRQCRELAAQLATAMDHATKLESVEGKCDNLITAVSHLRAEREADQAASVSAASAASAATTASTASNSATGSADIATTAAQTAATAAETAAQASKDIANSATRAAAAKRLLPMKVRIRERRTHRTLETLVLDPFQGRDQDTAKEDFRVYWTSAGTDAWPLVGMSFAVGGAAILPSERLDVFTEVWVDPLPGVSVPDRPCQNSADEYLESSLAPMLFLLARDPRLRWHFQHFRRLYVGHLVSELDSLNGRCRSCKPSRSVER